MLGKILLPRESFRPWLTIIFGTFQFVRTPVSSTGIFHVSALRASLIAKLIFIAMIALVVLVSVALIQAGYVILPACDGVLLTWERAHSGSVQDQITQAALKTGLLHKNSLSHLLTQKISFGRSGRSRGIVTVRVDVLIYSHVTFRFSKDRSHRPRSPAGWKQACDYRNVRCGTHSSRFVGFS